MHIQYIIHCQEYAGYIYCIDQCTVVLQWVPCSAVDPVVLERMAVCILNYARASDKISYEDHYYQPTALSRVQYGPRASPRAILVTLDNASV